MRSAYRLRVILSGVLLCLIAQAQQKTNPHTQISWPANCNNPKMAYNWQTNTCAVLGPVGNTGEIQVNQGGSWYSLPGFNYDFVNNILHAPNIAVPGNSSITLAPGNVTWPGSCTSGVYSPATNTCVPPGTAANPAPPSGSGQMNAGGIFQAIPGFTADPTLGYVTAGGLTYAKGNQTGPGANGIINAVANGKVVVADPSYGVTTTANMTQNSPTFTVTSAIGIVPGMQVSGNVMTGNGVVSNVAGNTITLNGTVALTTNPSATVTFYEMPYSLNGYNIPNASTIEYLGQLPGQRTDLKRDPPSNPFSRVNDFNTEGCFNTKHVAWLGPQTIYSCLHLDSWYVAPASDYGTTAAGHGFPSNWGVTTALQLNNVVSSKGIGELLGGSHSKAGIGDGPLWYFYYVDYLGSIAGADEGQGGPFFGGGEAGLTTTGTVSTGGGGTGATLLSINCATDCSANASINSGGPGQGRYFLDLSHPISFNMTARALGSGDTPGTITIDGGVPTAVPVSTFWGTLTNTTVTGNVTSGSNQVTSLSSTTLLGPGMPIGGAGIPGGATITAVNAGASSLTLSVNANNNATGATLTAGGDVPTPAPLSASGKPFAEQNPATVQTFVVAGGTFNTVANPGPPHVGDLICFSGTYHEQATVANVGGTGPWAITAALRMPHQAASWAFANGPCGDFVDFTANDVAANGTLPSQILHYPFDIVGATTATTLVYRWFSNLGNFPLGNIYFPFTGGGTLTNQAGIVTIPGITVFNHPELVGQSVITIAGAVNAAFNGSCTNVQPNGAGTLTCFQLASNNLSSAATTSFSYSIGTTGFGTTQGVLWQGAETLDILDYNEANCAATLSKHAPCYDNKNMVLEPNAALWANGDSVEQSHHYSSQIKGGKNGFNFYNPYQQANTNGWNYAMAGPGINGSAGWASMSFNNLNGVGMYQGHGGPLLPPGGVSLGFAAAPSVGTYTTPGYGYGLVMVTAPEPNGIGRGMWIGCPSLPWGCSDPTYNYKWFEGVGRVNGNYILFNPYNSDVLLGNPNNPVTWNGVNNDINYLQVRDQIKLSPMATPVINSIAPATANGTIPDGTRRYYTITARNFAGWSLASPEFSQITGTSGSNANTLTVFWSHVDGATQYQVCEGATPGSELLLATVAGVDNTSFVDAGGTSSGGCQNVATAPPLILTSQNTAFTDSLVAATGNPGNVIHTLPATGGTLALVPLSGVTGTIGGSALAAGACASGTAPITGVVAGQAGTAAASDGTYQAGFVINALGTGTNTATVYVCAIVAGTPTAKNYNVRIFP